MCDRIHIVAGPCGRKFRSGRAQQILRPVQMRGLRGFFKHRQIGERQIVLRHGPVQRHPVACAFLQRLLKGLDRLFQPVCAAVACPEGFQRVAKVVLRCGPAQRNGTRSRVCFFSAC